MTPLSGTEENQHETIIIMGGGICDATILIARHLRGPDNRGFRRVGVSTIFAK